MVGIIQPDEHYRMLQIADKIKWLGHVTRLTDERAAKKVITLVVSGRSRRDRPRTRWLGPVFNDLRTLWVTNEGEKELWTGNSGGQFQNKLRASLYQGVWYIYI